MDANEKPEIPAEAPAEVPTETPAQKRKRAIIGLIAAVLIGGAATGVAYYAENHAGWVARVDGHRVPKADWDRMMGNVRRQYQQRFNVDLNSPQGKAMEADMRTNLMNQMVERELIRAEAEKRKLTVDEIKLESKMDQIRLGFKTVQEFEAKLKENAMTPQIFEDQVRDSLLVEQVVDDVAKSAPVTDAEVKAYYRDNGQLYMKPDEVHARHILVKDPALAKTVYAKATAPGADFAALAKQYSEDPGSKRDGGDLGFFGKGRMVPEFEKAAFATAPGKIAPLFKSNFGWHVLKVEAKRLAHLQTYDEVQAEIRSNLAAERRRKAFTDWLEARKHEANIEYKPGYEPVAAQHDPEAGGEHAH